ncbi:MAG: hypothetical protein B6I38_03085 [Anaerolineaceae bacterium 4572_5.1]|nr:MAG: hypothetical protein B6I38_03085 [Anaerolineaceae bacterium 4572_5.1]
MEQITIQIRDKSKLTALFDFLKTLDFVEIIDTDKYHYQSVLEDEIPDFFSMAGLWEGRDIQQETLRQKAWPGRVR